MDETWGKIHRMRLKRDIDTLFREGKKVHVFPLLSHFHCFSHPSPQFSVLISVPKKRIKKAHDRNRIKRMIKECLRKHKAPLLTKTHDQGCCIHLSVVYLWEEIADYRKLEQQIQTLINKICA
ncbi:MAG: ribonuclease P protein component [Flavobacteriia bacterium]|nr:ribonuclease P protein component [Flavobacteriia bacterium]